MTDEVRTRYYQRATTWALDEQAGLRRSLRWSRIVGGVVALIAILEGFALVALAPLKTVTMVPVLVDRQTGFVERLNPDGSNELRANKALVHSLLAQYVLARESFNITNAAADYHKVALWSAGSARRDYLAVMPASNAQSPLRRYPRTTLIETSIASVSPIGPRRALVRFETRRKDQSAAPGAPQAWAAVIEYRFSNEALSASDRWLNPLGFQVVSYHRDPEALPPQASATNAILTPPLAATGPVGAPAQMGGAAGSVAPGNPR
jgi:type IV secretion system protein VirB8